MRLVHRIAALLDRPQPDAPADDAARRARETGFAQCIGALRGTLATTPVGWALVAWICWNRAPHAAIATWIGLFALTWLACLMLLAGVVRDGACAERHGRRLALVAAADGVAWGALVALLMGHDPVLDAWLAAVLAGVGAVNAPAYITHIAAYRVQIGALWATVTLASLANIDRAHAVEALTALTVFYGLMLVYMHGIAARVLDGLRLQVANAELVRQLGSALRLVERDATTDALTGLPNRRGLDEQLRAQRAAAEATGRRFSVLLIDVDHFKAVNDEHGHATGDEALRAFAARVSAQLRHGDVCARLGGEEFVAVLPGSGLSDAMDVAERLRAAVAAAPLLSAPRVAPTVSIGAAEYRSGQSLDDLLDAADRAVYAAKHGGRNRVCAAASAADAPALPTADV